MKNLNLSNHLIRDEIEEAIKKLNLNRKYFKEITKISWQSIIDKTVVTFAPFNNNLHWAWEHFNEPFISINFYNDFGYKHFSNIIDDEMAWFIAEDTFDKMWVYEVSPKFIHLILDECSYFEYYIVSKKFKWIICENHHGVLFACGDIISKMKELK